MFSIEATDSHALRFLGRLDASNVPKAQEVLDQVTESCVIDLEELKYVSSAGLGILFATQKRLRDAGKSLKLVNLNPHIRELFSIAGFDRIFEIE
jgi:anti-sigma B factor antagonist